MILQIILQCFRPSASVITDWIYAQLSTTQQCIYIGDGPSKYTNRITEPLETMLAMPRVTLMDGEGTTISSK